MERTVPTAGSPTTRPPLHGSQDGGRPRGRDAVPPALVIAIAFVVGMLAARMLDWRTHAHPRV